MSINSFLKSALPKILNKDKFLRILFCGVYEQILIFID